MSSGLWRLNVFDHLKPHNITRHGTRIFEPPKDWRTKYHKVQVAKYCICRRNRRILLKIFILQGNQNMASECTHISAPYISLLILKNVCRNIYKYSRDVEIRRVCMNLHSYLEQMMSATLLLTLNGVCSAFNLNLLSAMSATAS